VVVARAAASLGQLMKVGKAELAGQKAAVVAALRGAFEQAARDGWSFRVIGNALLDCGKDGLAVLHELRDQGKDPRLAELAWRVADLTQRRASFSEVTEAEDTAAQARRPSRSAP
jgi:hypothetical protein